MTDPPGNATRPASDQARRETNSGNRRLVPACEPVKSDRVLGFCTNPTHDAFRAAFPFFFPPEGLAPSEPQTEI